MKTHFLKIFLSTFLAFGVFSCNERSSVGQEENVARVQDEYLSKAELKKRLPRSLEDKDSPQNRYIIERWATKKLLLKRAEKNLSEEEKNDFEALVQQYREDLYINAYTNLLIEKVMDTLVSEAEIMAYYETHQNQFRLKADFLKLRYLVLPLKFPEKNKIKRAFIRFNSKDKDSLMAREDEMEYMALNDSVWKEKKSVVKELSAFQVPNKKLFSQLEDGFLRKENKELVLFLFIDKILKGSAENEITVDREKIKQIILNRRRLEVKKQLKRDILKDGIENGKFEILQ